MFHVVWSRWSLIKNIFTIIIKAFVVPSIGFDHLFCSVLASTRTASTFTAHFKDGSLHSSLPFLKGSTGYSLTLKKKTKEIGKKSKMTWFFLLLPISLMSFFVAAPGLQLLLLLLLLLLLWVAMVDLWVVVAQSFRVVIKEGWGGRRWCWEGVVVVAGLAVVVGLLLVVVVQQRLGTGGRDRKARGGAGGGTEFQVNREGAGSVAMLPGFWREGEREKMRESVTRRT